MLTVNYFPFFNRERVPLKSDDNLSTGDVLSYSGSSYSWTDMVILFSDEGR